MSSIPLPALSIRPPQINDPLETYGRMVQLKSMLQGQQVQQGQLQMQKLQMQQAQQDMQDDATARQVLSQTKGDMGLALPILAGKVSPRKLDMYTKAHLETQAVLSKKSADDLAVEARRTDQLFTMVDNASKMNSQQYLENYPTLAAQANKLHPELRVDPAKPIPQAQLPNLLLGLAVQKNYIERAAADKIPTDISQTRTVTTAKGIMQWNPETKRFDIPVGEAPGKTGSFEEQAYREWHALPENKNKSMIDFLKMKADATQRPTPEPGSYLPVNDNTGATIGWVNPKSGEYKSVADIKGMGGPIPAKPAGQERSRAAAAVAIEPLIQSAQAMLRDPKIRAKLGVLPGRVSEVERRLGSIDPDVAELYGTLKSIYSLGGTMHGWRALQVAQEFEKAYGGLHTDPDATIGGLNAMMNTASAVAKAGGKLDVGNAPQPGGLSPQAQALLKKHGIGQ